MKDILIAHGLQLRLGPKTAEDAESEVNTLREYFETRTIKSY
jgi:hypothetical protein